jgi:hypothetical protein
MARLGGGESDDMSRRKVAVLFGVMVSLLLGCASADLARQEHRDEPSAVLLMASTIGPIDAGIVPAPIC